MAKNYFQISDRKIASPDSRFKRHAVNVKPVDILRRLCSVYGNETQNISFVRRWVLRIIRNRESHYFRSGSTGTVTGEVHGQKVDGSVRVNHRIKQKKRSWETLGIRTEKKNEQIIAEVRRLVVCRSRLTILFGRRYNGAMSKHNNTYLKII